MALSRNLGFIFILIITQCVLGCSGKTKQQEGNAKAATGVQAQSIQQKSIVISENSSSKKVCIASDDQGALTTASTDNLGDAKGNHLIIKKFNSRHIQTTSIDTEIGSGICNSIVVGKDASIILTGMAPAQTDPAVPAFGFVAKFSNEGKREWITQLGTRATGIAQTSKDGFIVVGETDGEVSTTNLDRNGKVQWQSKFGPKANVFELNTDDSKSWGLIPSSDGSTILATTNLQMASSHMLKISDTGLVEIDRALNADNASAHSFSSMIVSAVSPSKNSDELIGFGVRSSYPNFGLFLITLDRELNIIDGKTISTNESLKTGNLIVSKKTGRVRAVYTVRDLSGQNVFLLQTNKAGEVKTRLMYSMSSLGNSEEVLGAELSASGKQLLILTFNDGRIRLVTQSGLSTF